MDSRRLYRLIAMACTGKPAIARAWWGDMPPFSPNPDGVRNG